MRFILALSLMTLFLTSCVPEEDAGRELHDIALYSNATDLRGSYGYLYGIPAELQVGTDTIALTEGRSNDPLAVSSALLVNGRPYLKTTLPRLSPPPSRVQRIPLTSDVELEVGGSAQAQEVIYFDGAKWFTLASEPAPTTGRRVVPRERLGGLKKVGNLTDEEAGMLEQVLAERAPVAVTLLPEVRVPQRRVDGLDTYLRTALYIQQTVPTDDAAYTPPAQNLIWEVLASGTQAVGGEGASFELITNEGDLLRIWNRAYGTRLSPPPLPDVNFGREAVAAAFLETKPTGGYTLEVQGVTVDGNDVFIDLLETTPPAGAITTQSLTTPWVIVRVLRENVGAAWFREPSTGRLIGVAQRIN